MGQQNPQEVYGIVLRLGLAFQMQLSDTTHGHGHGHSEEQKYQRALVFLSCPCMHVCAYAVHQMPV